jgi:hypothetical protein
VTVAPQTGAEALADDLRRYLGHQPFERPADTLAHRTRKFARRNRAAVALAAGVEHLKPSLGEQHHATRTAQRLADAAPSDQSR